MPTAMRSESEVTAAPAKAGSTVSDRPNPAAGLAQWGQRRLTGYRQWLKRVNSLGLRAWQPLVLLGLVPLSIVGVIGGAALGLRPVFLVSAVLGVVIDQVGDRVFLVQRLLDRAYLGLPERSMIREFALLLMFTRLGMPDNELSWSALLVFVVILTRALVVLADRQATALQMPKVITRNLPVPEVEESMPLSQVGLATLVAIGSMPLAGGLVSTYTLTVWPLLVASVAFALFAVGWAAWRISTWVTTTRRLGRELVMESASAAIARMRPEALIYFSGDPEALYQLEMWLPVLERLQRRCIVVLRERVNLDALKETSLPVICIPNPNDLMDFRLPTVRVAFYVAHVGKNIHMLREPRMKHVFIGHGESDKIASVNPVSKGFDEVWVAGAASRARWAAAKVGVRDDAIVEVGRPQLGGIEQAGTRPREGRPFSVIYAPTWEGWVNDPYASSLPLLGAELVKWLIERPDTRVIYKPHPFTGKVSAVARRVNAEVIAMIEASGGRNLSLAPVDEDVWTETVAQNLVVDGSTPTLYDCFNHCDALVGDISSVVPDFISSGKPYFIPNQRGADHQELRDSSASVRAAYFLDPDPADWEGVMADAAGSDSLRAARADLREFLLGPYYPDPVQPWREALDRLVAEANEEWPDAELEAGRLIED